MVVADRIFSSSSKVKEQNGPTFIDEVTGRTKITKYTDAAHPAARRQDQAHF